jgi:hypothetical protein
VLLDESLTLRQIAYQKVLNPCKQNVFKDFLFGETHQLTFNLKEKVSDAVSKCFSKIYSPEMAQTIVF